jgi:hypothetical protein
MLKDCDLVTARDKLLIGAQAKMELVSILQRDSAFLSELNLMDYSLFVAEVSKSRLILWDALSESLWAKLTRSACDAYRRATDRFSRRKDDPVLFSSDFFRSSDDGVSLLLNHDSVVYEDRYAYMLTHTL